MKIGIFKDETVNTKSFNSSDRSWGVIKKLTLMKTADNHTAMNGKFLNAI